MPILPISLKMLIMPITSYPFFEIKSTPENHILFCGLGDKYSLSGRTNVFRHHNNSVVMDDPV